uniref:Uncharacterized protein n=1 Tax=Arundo donax TaxID=35708 RepID=A0A0A8Y754_ARUDO
MTNQLSCTNCQENWRHWKEVSVVVNSV